MVQRITSFQARDGEQPRFLQVYTAHTNDPAQQLRDRLYDPGREGDGPRAHENRRAAEETFDKIQQDILALQTLLGRINPYVLLYKHAAEMEVEQELRVVLHHRSNVRPEEGHPRQWNLPTADEVGVIVVGDENHVTTHRDIVQHRRGYGMNRVKIFHR
jgi:hypothetical protein